MQKWQRKRAGAGNCGSSSSSNSSKTVDILVMQPHTKCEHAPPFSPCVCVCTFSLSFLDTMEYVSVKATVTITTLSHRLHHLFLINCFHWISLITWALYGIYIAFTRWFIPVYVHILFMLFGETQHSTAHSRTRTRCFHQYIVSILRILCTNINCDTHTSAYSIQHTCLPCSHSSIQRSIYVSVDCGGCVRKYKYANSPKCNILLFNQISHKAPKANFNENTHAHSRPRVHI